MHCPYLSSYNWIQSFQSSGGVMLRSSCLMSYAPFLLSFLLSLSSTCSMHVYHLTWTLLHVVPRNLIHPCSLSHLIPHSISFYLLLSHTELLPSLFFTSYVFLLSTLSRYRPWGIMSHLTWLLLFTLAYSNLRIFIYKSPVVLHCSVVRTLLKLLS